MGFSLKNVDKSALNKFTPNDAYGHKDTRELIKNDEIAKAIYDNALKQAQDLAKDYVLKANNGVAFTDSKKDAQGKVSSYTPKIVVKVEPRLTEDTEFVTKLDDEGFPKIQKNPDGSPMTKPKTEMKNGKEVKVMRAIKLEELPENQQGNKGNLYSTSMSYTIKGQTLKAYASVKVDENDGKPTAKVNFVTPIVSQYSANPIERQNHTAKGVDGIKAEIANPKSWINPEMKAVVSKVLESGVIAEKTSSQTVEYAKALSQRFADGLKVEIPKRERDANNNIVYAENGKPKTIEGETEIVPMCYTKTFANSISQGVMIYNRKDSNISIELGSYKGADGSERTYAKSSDWDLTYPTGNDGRPDRNAEPIDRTEKFQMPVSQNFNSAEGVVSLVPPIPELHEILCERLNISQEEYSEVFEQAYGNEPSGANGFGNKDYANEEAEIEQPTVESQEQQEQEEINPDDFEEIMNGDDIPF